MSWFQSLALHTFGFFCLRSQNLVSFTPQFSFTYVYCLTLLNNPITFNNDGVCVFVRECGFVCVFTIFAILRVCCVARAINIWLSVLSDRSNISASKVTH